MKKTLIFVIFFEEEEEDEKVNRECEKLFHPERFEIDDLTTSISTLEAANPDLGALFYAQNKELVEEVSEPEEKHVVLEDPKSGELFQPSRKYGEFHAPSKKYGRSMSATHQPHSSTAHGNFYLNQSYFFFNV